MVLYIFQGNSQHAVLLTRIENDILYCLDPALTNGNEMPVSSSYLGTLFGRNQSSILAQYINTWIISSSSNTASYHPAVKAPSFISAEITEKLGCGISVEGVGQKRRQRYCRVQFPTWTEYNGQDDIQATGRKQRGKRRFWTGGFRIEDGETSPSA